MFALVTCVTAACDACGTAFDDTDDDVGGVFHFPDQDAAVQWMTEYGGWRVQAGGRLTCRDCAATQDCAIYGHLWEPWRPCACAGHVRDHDTDHLGGCTRQYRWCERCQHADRRPVTTEEASR